MESIAPISSIKSLFEQLVNCWLQYVLAQPIRIDLPVAIVLTLQLMSAPKILVWLREIHAVIQNMLRPPFNQLILEEA